MPAFAQKGRTVVAVFTVAAFALSADASSAAPLPPGFKALLAKIAEIEPSSISATVTFDVAARRPHGGWLRIHATESGVETASPLASSGATAVRGWGHAYSGRFRVVDGRTYEYEYERGLWDGGRPWVERTEEQPYEETPLNLEQPLLLSQKRPFARWASEFERARSVRALGPATIDGRSATGFLALRSHERDELFVSSDGVPILTRFVGQSHDERASGELVVHAIDFPLTIEPPPPSHVIGEAELNRLERASRGRSRRAK